MQATRRGASSGRGDHSQGPEGGSGRVGLAARPRALGSGRAKPLPFLWWEAGVRRERGNPMYSHDPFLGSCRALRLIRPSLVGMRPARVELGLHFRASSTVEASLITFLENGVVLIVFFILRVRTLLSPPPAFCGPPQRLF